MFTRIARTLIMYSVILCTEKIQEKGDNLRFWGKFGNFEIGQIYFQSPYSRLWKIRSLAITPIFAAPGLKNRVRSPFAQGLSSKQSVQMKT